jgi:4-diphosphocytidyl-2-C-methyl-D-erythritol kinase
LLNLEAHAKVNLTLEVLGRRDDGYHDIVSIVQTIDLCDTLTLELAREVTLECDAPELQSSDNLVLRAAALLSEMAGGRGAAITLRKRIPVSAGLGGGSSDAAATLRGLNRLWELGLSRRDLMPLAARLGSDVPFFLYGGTAMVRGRGEGVRPLPPADLDWFVLLTPAVQLSSEARSEDARGKTAAMFGRLTDANFTRGALTRKLEARIRGGGDVPPQFLFNAFDAVAFDAFTDLETHWSTFESLGAREIHLAGAGPSMFAPVSRKEFGTALQLMLGHRHGYEAHLVSTWRQPEDLEC